MLQDRLPVKFQDVKFKDTKFKHEIFMRIDIWHCERCFSVFHGIYKDKYFYGSESSYRLRRDRKLRLKKQQQQQKQYVGL